ncbi:MAG TPA: PspC domain-containing protein [Bryobacteraceae bacterium]|jgi:phage shock protein C
MYCTNCGIQIDKEVRYCHDCGAATSNAAPGATGARQFRRPASGGKIAGVCAGVAQYFGLDVSLVRILWIVLTIYPPAGGLLAYIICWIVMPKEPWGESVPGRAATDTPRPA